MPKKMYHLNEADLSPIATRHNVNVIIQKLRDLGWNVEYGNGNFVWQQEGNERFSADFQEIADEYNPMNR